MEILTTVLWTLLVITSVLLIALVLMHSGKGGGISDMFGGGVSSGIQSTGLGERNLNRITWSVVVVFGVIVILLGLIAKYVG